MKIEQEYLLKQDDQNHYLEINKMVYKINLYFFFLLSLQKEGQEREESLIALKEEFNFDHNQVALVNEEYEKFISQVRDKKPKDKKNYIRFKKVLLSEEVNRYLSSKFTFLFNKKVMVFLFPFIIALNAVFLALNPIEVVLSLHWSEYIYTFLFFGLAFVFHELGHSSALMKFGQLPNEIGFGIYFIFPVLYSDVTSTWVLPKKQKLIVNAGGLYFQLFINAFLVLFLFFNKSTDSHFIIILKSIAFSNITIVIYNLLPFLRMDGYWIYADFFSIHNLMKKADTLHNNLNLGYLKRNLPVVVFSLANWLFRLYIIIFLIELFIGGVKELTAFILNKETIMTYLTIAFSSVGLIIMVRNLYRILTNKTKVNEGV